MPFSGSQTTALSPVALPGRPHAFTAKSGGTTFDDTGASVATPLVSGADVAEWADSGLPISALAPAGTDAVEFIESGTGVYTPVISGADAVEGTFQDTGVAIATPSLSGANIGQGTALRFYGTGSGNIDRVRIPIDPPDTKPFWATSTSYTADDFVANDEATYVCTSDHSSGASTEPGVGVSWETVWDLVPQRPPDVSADFTVEFWVNGLVANNPAAEEDVEAEGWIRGNIIFDRDIFDSRDEKFGISFADGLVCFGISDTIYTVIGTSNVLDGDWHHVACQRVQSTGVINVYVDGTLEVSEDASYTGTVSYPDGLEPGVGVNNRYIVLGAEKHDAGSAYPSFNGFMTELRISDVVRYTSGFTRPNTTFSPDANTVALYHFDEATGTALGDSATVSGAPTDGELLVGGASNGPTWEAVTTPIHQGVTAVEYAETGTAIQSPSQSGLDVAEFVESGSAAATMAPAGTDATEWLDSGLETVFPALSGEEGITRQDDGAPTATAAPEGADAVEWVDSGLEDFLASLSGSDSAEYSETGVTPAYPLVSGADGITLSDSGLASAYPALSGLDSIILVDGASPTLAAALSGLDVVEYTETGTLYAYPSLEGSQAEGSIYTDSGLAIAYPALSGLDAVEFIDAVLAQISQSLSGLDSITFSEQGQAAATPDLSGSDSTVFAESGAATPAASLSGADVFIFVDGGNVSYLVLLSGADEVEEGSGEEQDTGLAIATPLLFGADIVEFVDSGAATLTVVLSGLDSSVVSEAVAYGFVVSGKTAGIVE